MIDFYYETIGTAINPVTSLDELEIAMFFAEPESNIYITSSASGELLEVPAWMLEKLEENDIRIYIL